MLRNILDRRSEKVYGVLLYNARSEIQITLTIFEISSPPLSKQYHKRINNQFRMVTAANNYNETLYKLADVFKKIKVSKGGSTRSTRLAFIYRSEFHIHSQKTLNNYNEDIKRRLEKKEWHKKLFYSVTGNVRKSHDRRSAHCSLRLGHMEYNDDNLEDETLVPMLSGCSWGQFCVVISLILLDEISIPHMISRVPLCFELVPCDRIT
jgi:hypothetical protein